MRLKATSLVLFLLLLWQCSALGAPAQGQITGVEVSPQGYTVNIYVYQMPTNGWFTFGHESSTNHVYATTNLLLTVTSQGFDDACNQTTIVRRVRGSVQMRYPYTQQTNIVSGWYNITTRAITNGSDGTVYTAILDDYVHFGDSNIIADISSGLITNSSVVSISTNSILVTNLSTIPYPRVIANWSWPGFEVISNSFVTNRVLAFNQYGQQGRPVRAVKFWGIDASGNTNEPFIAKTLTLVTNNGDQIPVQEYVGVLSTTNLANNKLFTNYFKAYPWIGGNDAVYDSSATYLEEWCWSKGIQFLKDTNNAYGTSFCVLDPVNGSAAGVVSSSFDPAAPPTPFSTFKHALSAATRSNVAFFGRSNIDNTYFFLTNGRHYFTNVGSLANDSVARYTWAVITPFPGVSSNACPIGRAGTWTDNGPVSPVKLDGVFVDFEGSAGSSMFLRSPKAFWMDRSYYATSNRSGMFQNITNRNMTRCIAYSRPESSGLYPKMIWRGNYFDLRTNQAPDDFQDYSVFCGNIVTNFPKFKLTVSSNDKDKNQIVAYNAFLQLSNHDQTFVITLSHSYDSAWSYTNGAATVGNLVEGKYYGSTVLSFVSIGDSGPHITNLIVWNNTFMGGKHTLFPNFTCRNVSLYSLKNNFVDGIATFLTDESDTGYTNMWSEMFGVSQSGNFYGPVREKVFHEYYGQPNVLGRYGFVGVSSGTHTNTNNVFGNFAMYRPESRAFTNNLSTTTGDYHPTNGSPAFGLVETLTLPYDLWGSPRYVGGPSGALEGTNTGYPPVGITGRIKRIWLRNFHH